MIRILHNRGRAPRLLAAMALAVALPTAAHEAAGPSPYGHALHYCADAGDALPAAHPGDPERGRPGSAGPAGSGEFRAASLSGPPSVRCSAGKHTGAHAVSGRAGLHLRQRLQL